MNIDKSPIVAHIVATTEDGLIGIGDKLPWSPVSEDMQFFKAKTLKHIVVMGYNTVLSLPFKLPKRYTVGVSSRPCNDNVGSDIVFHQRSDNIITRVKHPNSLRSIKELLDDGKDSFNINHGYLINPDVVYIAGGGKIYEDSLLEVDVVYRNVIRKPLEKLEGVEVYYPVNRLREHFILLESEEIEIKGGSMIKEIWVKPR